MLLQDLTEWDLSLCSVSPDPLGLVPTSNLGALWSDPLLDDYPDRSEVLYPLLSVTL
jgi:hypothetical protein